MKVIDLDANATTRVDERALAEMVRVMRHEWGNASSDNQLGVRTREEVAYARARVANLIEARDEEVLFTAGATASMNIALRGVIAARYEGKRHVVTSKAEHKGTISILDYLQRSGAIDITALDPDRWGRVSAGQVADALREDTLMVCLSHGNNEIGTINDVESIAETLSDSDVLFVVDAAQTAGYSAPSVKTNRIDLMSVSSHKLYGPLGIGALYVRNGTRIAPILYGGGQERGLVPGTLNVPGIVGMGKAAELAHREGSDRAVVVRQLRDLLFRLLSDAIPDIELNGHPDQRLPGNLSLTIPYVPADILQKRLPELAFSRGSACTSGSGEPSNVLRAIGLSGNQLHWTIRIGLSIMNTETEIRRAARLIASAVASLRDY